MFHTWHIKRALSQSVSPFICENSLIIYQTFFKIWTPAWFLVESKAIVPIKYFPWEPITWLVSELPPIAQSSKLVTDMRRTPFEVRIHSCYRCLHTHSEKWPHCSVLCRINTGVLLTAPDSSWIIHHRTNHTIEHGLVGAQLKIINLK